MAVDIAFNTRIQVATFDKQTDGSYLLGEYSNQMPAFIEPTSDTDREYTDGVKAREFNCMVSQNLDVNLNDRVKDAYGFIFDITGVIREETPYHPDSNINHTEMTLRKRQ